MEQKRHTEPQIVFALQQAESGTLVADICRKMGIAEATFYRWKKRYGDLDATEIRRLRQLEDENRRLHDRLASAWGFREGQAGSAVRPRDATG